MPGVESAILCDMKISEEEHRHADMPEFRHVSPVQKPCIRFPEMGRAFRRHITHDNDQAWILEVRTAHTFGRNSALIVQIFIVSHCVTVFQCVPFGNLILKHIGRTSHFRANSIVLNNAGERFVRSAILEIDHFCKIVQIVANSNI